MFNTLITVQKNQPLFQASNEALAAQKMANLGIQAVIVDGVSKDLSTVKITKDGVNFLEGSTLKGVGNYGIIDTLKAEHGDNVAIISIGPAGEGRLKAASVAVTSPDFRIRMAGRGGLGPAH